MSGEGCPISWLELERRSLDELPPSDRARVDAHLDGCATCRARSERIAVDQRPMPPLRVEPIRRWWPAVGGLALAAAALVVVLVGQRDPPPTVKGDTLAIVVVRERAGAVVEDPTDFRRGDRFRVLLTCPPGAEVAEIAVFQGDEVFYPLETAELRCGNRVPLAGAFRLTGELPVEVCAIPAGSDAPVGCVRMVAGE